MYLTNSNYPYIFFTYFYIGMKITRRIASIVEIKSSGFYLYSPIILVFFNRPKQIKS